MAGGSTVDEETDDVALVLRLMDRDEAALSIIVRRYSGKVLSALRNYFQGKVCEDTLNDGLNHAVWVLWNKPDRFDYSKGSLGGFLYICARNRVLDILRKGKKRRNIVSLETLGNDIPAQERVEEEPPTAKKEKLYEELHRCIQSSLTPLERQIIEADLVAGGDADSDYLVDALQTTKGSIYASRSKAKGKIKAAMKKAGHFR
jgi:RNA polymerase sigma-70 factor (ECF subfamily)